MIDAVFAYGTLQIPDVMRAVTGRSFAARPALLDGYARFQLRGCNYPGIVECHGFSTPGLLYTGLDPAALRALDRFEDEVYVRRAVRVRTAGGGVADAQAYVVPRECRATLTNRPWSVEDFARSHLGDFVRACEGFRRRYGRDRGWPGPPRF